MIDAMDENTEEVQQPEEQLVPEGVDLSDAIEIPEGAEIADISLVKTEEDLVNLTVQRILDLDEDSPVYADIIEGIASSAKLSWYNRGDYEVFKLYIRKNPSRIFKHFEDLRELRVQIKKDKLKRARRRRGK